MSKIKLFCVAEVHQIKLHDNKKSNKLLKQVKDGKKNVSDANHFKRNVCSKLAVDVEKFHTKEFANCGNSTRSLLSNYFRAMQKLCKVKQSKSSSYLSAKSSFILNIIVIIASLLL